MVVGDDSTMGEAVEPFQPKKELNLVDVSDRPCFEFVVPTESVAALRLKGGR